MGELLIALHLLGNLVWIGAISSAGLVTKAAADAGDTPEGRVAARLAHGLLYKRIANPAFFASFAFGVTRLLLSPAAYMGLHWFHGKLAFALAAIALHHVIGGKARKVDAGSMQSGRSSAILTGALLACVFLTVVFVVFKSELVR